MIIPEWWSNQSAPPPRGAWRVENGVFVRAPGMPNETQMPLNGLSLRGIDRDPDLTKDPVESTWLLVCEDYTDPDGLGGDLRRGRIVMHDAARSRAAGSPNFSGYADAYAALRAATKVATLSEEQANVLLDFRDGTHELLGDAIFGDHDQYELSRADLVTTVRHAFVGSQRIEEMLRFIDTAELMDVLGRHNPYRLIMKYATVDSRSQAMLRRLEGRQVWATNSVAVFTGHIAHAESVVNRVLSWLRSTTENGPWLRADMPHPERWANARDDHMPRFIADLEGLRLDPWYGPSQRAVLSLNLAKELMIGQRPTNELIREIRGHLAKAQSALVRLKLRSSVERVHRSLSTLADDRFAAQHELHAMFLPELARAVYTEVRDSSVFIDEVVPGYRALEDALMRLSVGDTDYERAHEQMKGGSLRLTRLVA